MKLGQDDQQSQGDYVQTIYLVLDEHMQDVISAKFMEKAKYLLLENGAHHEADR